MDNFEYRRGYASWKIDFGKVNAFGTREIGEMDGAIDICNQNFFNNIKALRIKSEKISPNGKRIFSAGANLKERRDWTRDQILSHLAHQRQVVHRLRTSPFFAIVYVDGIAQGLGVEMCLAADVVISSSRSSFALPEYRLGIIPGAGGYTWAHHLSKHKHEAISWMEQGSIASAEYAQWLGIVDTVIDVECTGGDEGSEADPSDIYVEEIVSWLATLSREEQIERKSARYKDIDFDAWFEEEQTEYARRLSMRKDNDFIV